MNPYPGYDPRWQVPPMQRYGPPPANHLVWGLLLTIACLSPLGVVALVYSTRVDTLWAEGRFDEARRASRSAKLWVIWGFCAQVALMLLALVAYLGFWMFIGYASSR